MASEAHPTARREPDPEGIFRDLPDPDPEPDDMFRGLPEPDPEPRLRALTDRERAPLVGALAGLLLADLDARRGGAP